MKIGVVDLDTSHPQNWIPIERDLGHEVAGIWDGGAVHPPGYVAATVAFAFGLAAASFFPVLVLGVFSKRVTREGAIAGMVTGIGFTAAYILYFKILGWGDRGARHDDGCRAEPVALHLGAPDRDRSRGADVRVARRVSGGGAGGPAQDVVPRTLGVGGRGSAVSAVGV